MNASKQMLKSGFAALVAIASNSALASDRLEHDRIYRSPYYQGRGDTGIGDADNVDAIYYNPAGLAQGKGVYKQTVLASPAIEYSLATRDLYRKINVEEEAPTDALKDAIGESQHFGVQNVTALVFRRAALSVFESGQADIMVYKSKEASGLETVDTFASANAGVTFSLAEAFMNNSLLIGMTAKYLAVRASGGVSASILDASDPTAIDTDNLAQMGSGSGADLGLMWKSDTGSMPSFGLTVENAGDIMIVPEDETKNSEALHQTVNLGFSARPGTKYSRFHLLFDYRDATNAYGTNLWLKTHFGAEISMKNIIGFNAGLNQGYGTGGVFLNLYFVRIDLASYTQEMGERAGDRPDTRYVLRVSAGF